MCECIRHFSDGRAQIVKWLPAYGTCGIFGNGFECERSQGVDKLVPGKGEMSIAPVLSWHVVMYIRGCACCAKIVEADNLFRWTF